MINHSRHYHGVAICLHWIIAILLLVMFVVGTYMVGLDETDPLRYVLTQWHKSFGVIALLLIILRVFWRLTHPAPTLPDYLRPWEKQVASFTHVALYLLIFLIPMSGWIMISASPLELPTLVFNKIPWPHLPIIEGLPNKNEVALLFGKIHEVVGYLLILILIAHIGAALRHRFVLHDDIMERMSPKAADGDWIAGIRPTFGAILFIVGGLALYGYAKNHSSPLIIGSSQVRFEFILLGRLQEGAFIESNVEMLIDSDNSTVNRLYATVNTRMVSTGNSQIDTTLASESWFDSENHPQALFESKKLILLGENSYSVLGTLSIKGVSRKLSFPVILKYSDGKRIASGGFTVSRLDFNLGSDSHPDDEVVKYPVTIKFTFEVR